YHSGHWQPQSAQKYTDHLPSAEKNPMSEQKQYHPTLYKPPHHLCCHSQSKDFHLSDPSAVFPGLCLKCLLQVLPCIRRPCKKQSTLPYFTFFLSLPVIKTIDQLTSSSINAPILISICPW